MEDLTLEQAVQKTTMPEFGVYALLGLVNSGLNVPAAY